MPYCAVPDRPSERVLKPFISPGQKGGERVIWITRLGITTLNDVCEDARRITAACPLPLLVDADTGGVALSTLREPSAS